MYKPVIGLTPGHNTDTQDAFLRSTYLQALTAIGAIPVMLPLEPYSDDYEQIADAFDGFLFTGGPDVQPFLFGEETHEHCGNASSKRDSMELALLSRVMAAKKPVFGICRGVQLLNVYFGGTLCQQVPGHADGARHTVHAVPGSRIEALCGAAFETNSWHHQAADALAPGLRCTASSPDGLAEALEHEAFPVFGVQWHPERMLPGLCADVDTDHQCLFDDFIKECGAHHE